MSFSDHQMQLDLTQGQRSEDIVEQNGDTTVWTGDNSAENLEPVHGNADSTAVLNGDVIGPTDSHSELECGRETSLQLMNSLLFDLD